MWKLWVTMVTFAVVSLSLHVLPGDSIGQQLPSDPHHRVVMHLNSGDEKVQRGALNNIRHLYQEVGREHLQVELVVHGAGLALLIKGSTGFGSELAQLKKRVRRTGHGLFQYHESHERDARTAARRGRRYGSGDGAVDGTAGAGVGLYQAVNRAA
jgi:hypothetical protein